MGLIARVAVAFTLSLPIHSIPPSLAAEPVAAIAPDAEHIEKDRLVERLLAAERTRDVVDAWLPLLMSQDPNSCHCAESAEEARQMQADWAEAVAAEFDPVAIMAALHRSLREAFTKEELAELVQIAEGPLMRKLRAGGLTDGQYLAESAPTDPEADLGDMPLSTERIDPLAATTPERRAILEDILELAGGRDTIADLMVDFSIGAALGTASVLSEHEPTDTSAAEIAGRVEATRENVRASLRSLALIGAAEAHSVLDDVELATYRDHLATPLAQRSVRVNLDTFDQILKMRGLAIGARYGRAQTGLRL